MLGLVEIKNQEHLVLKNADIEKYLSKKQRKQLEKIESTIIKGRLLDNKKYNTYYICNQDEPYASSVINTILTGELNKQYNTK